MNIREATAKNFEIIPGVGKKLSQELFDLGYRKVSELKGEDPEIMYQNLRGPLIIGNAHNGLCKCEIVQETFKS